MKKVILASVIAIAICAALITRSLIDLIFKGRIDKNQSLFSLPFKQL